MDIYIGIDPGKTGAWAVISADNEHILHSSFGGYREFQEEIYCLALDHKVALVVLEQVHAMPGQGVKSMFTFGANYGGWLATLELMALPHILVRPQIWQRGIIGVAPKGQSKVKALAYAQRKYPALNLKKSHSGIVDALCLAEYGRRYG